MTMDESVKFKTSRLHMNFSIARALIFAVCIVGGRGYDTLDGYAKPLHYDLDIFPDIYYSDTAQFKLYGNVTVTFSPQQRTYSVRLDTSSLAIDTADIHVSTIAGDRIGIAEVRADNDSLNVVTQTELLTDTSYTISLAYIAPIGNDMRGIFHSVDEVTGLRFVLTHLHPDNARRLFPCVDHPAAKAPFSVKVWRKESMASLTNMERLRTFSNGGLECDVYPPTPPMSTYLLAVVVHPYFPHRETISATGTLVRVWSRPSIINYMGLVLETAAKSIDFYVRKLGQPFPLRKLDLFVSPDLHASGMENWGLVTLVESNSVYDPRTSATDQKMAVVITVAHEVAHQWFGDLVTHVSWDDTWITEGSATFMSNVCVEEIYPDMRAMETFLITKVSQMMRMDVWPTVRPVRTHITSHGELNSIFDAVTYLKGAALFHTIYNFIGEARFWEGIQSYLSVYKTDSASVQQLIELFQASVDNIHVSSVLAAMLDNPGFITFDVKYTENTRWNLDVAVSESSAIRMSPAAEETAAALLPVVKVGHRITCDKDRSYLRLNLSLSLASDWVEQLLHNHMTMTPVERFRLVDDLNYFGFEKGKTTLLLKSLTYLGKEANPIVFKNLLLLALKVVDSFDNAYHRALAEDYILGQLGSSLIGLFHYLSQPGPGINLQQRDIILASFLKTINHPYFTLMATNVYKQFIDDPHHSRLDPDLLPIIGCAALKEGSSAMWKESAALFTDTSLITQRMALAQALVCTPHRALLKRFLHLAKTRVHLKDEADMIAYLAASGPTANEVAFEHILQDREKIQERFGYSSIYYRTFETVMGRMSPEFVRAFQEKYDGLDDSEKQVIKHVLEKSNSTKVRGLRRDELYAWITQISLY